MSRSLAEFDNAGTLIAKARHDKTGRRVKVVLGQALRLELQGALGEALYI